MASRTILASKRFRNQYPTYLKKYGDLETNFRDFLEFRCTHRPDEPFGTKDSRMTGTKFHRCHLIHGKAIVIYQPHGREIRLVAIEEHNAVEGGTNRQVRRYADSLTQDDYYLFDVDCPVPVKQKSEEVPMDQRIDEPIVAEEITIEQSSPEPVPEPLRPVAEPEAQSPLWNDRVVEFLHDRNMLVVPRPAREMVAITLDKELIAPRGDVLLIDMTGPTIYHLTYNEYEAHFQPAPRHTTSLSEALEASMAVERTTARARAKAPEPKPEPKVVPDKTESDGEPERRDVAPQLGRLLVVMNCLQRQLRTTRIDNATLKDYLHERDARSLSPVMSTAQSKGLVRKSGIKKGGGRAFYYCLTTAGEQKARSLGDWPFTVAGLRPPFVGDKYAAGGSD
jgi:hypothetical protein